MCPTWKLILERSLLFSYLLEDVHMYTDHRILTHHTLLVFLLGSVIRLSWYIMPVIGMCKKLKIYLFISEGMIQPAMLKKFLLKLHNCKDLVLLLTASAACSKLTIAMIIFHALEARMAWKERKKSCTLNKAMPSGICYFLQTELYCSHAQWDYIFH